jgi:hypothetical protein
MVSFDHLSIILTSTIDVKGVANMQRADPLLRLADHERALRRWLDDPHVRNIVLVENSGYDLGSLRALAEGHPAGKDVEFLSFDGQDFPRSRGKGYGETLALQHVVQHSRQLRRTGRFLKVNGRYYVPNVADVVAGMDEQAQVFCNLNRGMTFSDSRVFGGSREFLERFVVEGLRIDDETNVWFEHALARAALVAIADGLPWNFITRLPRIDGISGTINGAYAEPAYKQWLKGRVHALKQRLLRW